MKKNLIISLPKDLQMKLLCFLTLSEMLVLTQCSSDLKAAFTGEEVWRDFIKRISPSILALPMNSLTSTKERLKVMLGRKNYIHSLNYTKLRMHYILEVIGNKHAATLSNPTKIDNDLLTFWSEKDLGYKVPCHRWESASLTVLMIYDGKTSLLIPRCTASDFHGEGKLIFVNSYLPKVDGHDCWVTVTVCFTWIGHRRDDSSSEEHELDGGGTEEHPEYPGYLTGIESVDISVVNSENVDVIDFLRLGPTWY